MAVPPASQRSERLDEATESDRPANRRVAVALHLMVIAVVVLQRFAVPGIGTALCLPVVMAILAYLVHERAVVLDTMRTRLYLLAAGICCAATLLSASYFKDEWSLKSLALLVVLYIPFCLRLRPDLRYLYRPLLGFFNTIMLVLACVALTQWAAQLVGWTYSDPLDLVPDQFLIQTYNTSYPIYYGSPIMKANAFAFLEPSFCSQFLAVAIIVQLLLGRSRWRLPLYAAALLTTVSGTGIILVGVGLAVLAVRRGPAWMARTLLLLLLIGVMLLSTPLAQILARRSSEQAEQGSSGQARFVAPYVLIASGLTADIPTLLVGRGPGIVSRTAGAEQFNAERIEANYPVIPKLAAEYGVIATMVFSWFAIVAMSNRTPSVTMSIMMLVVYFVLSGSLLQPSTVLAAYVFTSLFAARPSDARSGSNRMNERPEATTGRADAVAPTVAGAS